MADVEVAALLTAEVKNLSPKRGRESLFLQHKAAALGVLDHERTLLSFFLSSVPAGKGGGQEETPHA